MTSNIGIVHLGLGAFHRAHQAAYLDAYAKRTGNSDWAICSANLRSNQSLVDALASANYRYHLVEYTDRKNANVRTIDSIKKTLFTGRDADGHWGRDLDELLLRMSDASVHIVTLTVTEKGYFLSPSDAQLLTDAPDIAADINNPKQPRTAPGILVEALRRRRAADIAPFTVLCCDNMPANGERTRAAVCQLAAQNDPELADWIAAEVAFPSSMVDRIVPAMTDAEFDRLKALGIDDANAVVSEAFSQWVVEDHFPSGRPDWQDDGVQMVADVAPFEDMKLRLLNGSHSLLAYLGSLAGFATVADAVGNAQVRAFLKHYMLNEAAPTLAMPAGTDLHAYCDQLLHRFANDSLNHRLHQIAMDGSQKLPQRWLAGALEHTDRARNLRCTALGIAAWIRYTSGFDGRGQAHTVSDPLADTLAALHQQHDRVEDLIAAFFALRAVFPPELASDANWQTAVVDAYRQLDAVLNFDVDWPG
ncbi:mannitol dehydrogenase family protein [Saccharospirillum mangrovi]|uniref:mannitol dehydrogenase family protein n=1 Tax=Saccharospirillum mangrovi TaxID=2161747 RepID=UPI000D3BFD82|nr:mannitol dehydrogenase family protein [Saccharospirillum mangrovi]